MDGNGRWARQQGADRIFGHQNGVNSVREATEGCIEAGVRFLTLYAFSTENWKRPESEVQALMELLVATIQKEVPELHENGVRLRMIGDMQALPEKSRLELLQAIELTANNAKLDLVLALSYSGRWDIRNAAKQLALDIAAGKLNPEAITDEVFSSHLSTAGIPDPALLIRTSGEFRISNFLLWEIAYAEIVILEELWPEFTRESLFKSIHLFQQRERRFGLTGDQLASA
jgi:undecaprenyl diphosphate synthase